MIMADSNDFHVGDRIDLNYRFRGVELKRFGYVYSIHHRHIRLSDQPPKEVLWWDTQKIKYYNILTYEKLKKGSNLEERATETDPVDWI